VLFINRQIFNLVPVIINHPEQLCLRSSAFFIYHLILDFQEGREIMIGNGMENVRPFEGIFEA
jgi:hypothetical protein